MVCQENIVYIVDEVKGFESKISVCLALILIDGGNFGLKEKWRNKREKLTIAYLVLTG